MIELCRVSLDKSPWLLLDNHEIAWNRGTSEIDRPKSGEVDQLISKSTADMEHTRVPSEENPCQTR